MLGLSHERTPTRFDAAPAGMYEHRAMAAAYPAAAPPPPPQPQPQPQQHYAPAPVSRTLPPLHALGAPGVGFAGGLGGLGLGRVAAQQHPGPYPTFEGAGAALPWGQEAAYGGGAGGGTAAWWNNGGVSVGVGAARGYGQPFGAT